MRKYLILSFFTSFLILDYGLTITSENIFYNLKCKSISKIEFNEYLSSTHYIMPYVVYKINKRNGFSVLVDHKDSKYLNSLCDCLQQSKNKTTRGAASSSIVKDYNAIDWIKKTSRIIPHQKALIHYSTDDHSLHFIDPDLYNVLSILITNDFSGTHDLKMVS